MRTQANTLTALGAALAISLGTLGTTGCGTITTAATSAVASTVTTATATGHVRGGLTGVAHTSIQLYAAGATGYGGAAQPLLSPPVVADSKGDFSLPDSYTCPTPTTPVYLLATGGDSGRGTNPNLVLMTALGPCGTIATSSLTINEVTTVAAAYALLPFMNSPTQLGTSASNAKGLTHAFATAARLADSSTGAAPGTLPAGAIAPVAMINTLADVLAACVDTVGGVASDGSTCGRLFAAATPVSGVAPVDTLTALLNIARSPGRNVAALFSLVSAHGPYEPTSASVSDFTLAIKYKPTLSSPSAAAVDAQGNLWVTNAGSNSVSVVDATGEPLPGSPFRTGSLNAPSAVATDAAGNAWVTNKNGSTLSVFTPGGVGTSVGVAGLNAPSGIAIDRSGVLWVANSGSNSVSAVTVSGTKVVTAVNYTAGGIDAPTAIAVDPF